MELFVEDRSIEGSLSGLPYEVSEGELSVGEWVCSNIVPLPLNRNGNTMLSLLLKWNERVVIRGSGIATGFEGLLEDPEDFPGMDEQ